MKIERINITGSYRHFWFKTVQRVDLSKHCSYCLIGRYDRRIPIFGEVRDLELKDAVYYMCGVSLPYVWAKNFHLAFMPKEGETLHLCEKGVDLIVQDAIPLPIDESYIDPSDPNASKNAFRTCRNWQFAHYFAKNLIPQQNLFN